MVSTLGKPVLSRNTLRWLLEPSAPSARYLTLTRILSRQEEDPQVLASRAAIPQASPARDILLAQYPQGYWMHSGIGYSPRYRATVWQILFLAQLGMARCDSLDRAVGHLFETNQREDGAFRASKEPRDTPTCLNGSLLWALEVLGYGDAAEVGSAWSWLAQQVEDYGFGATYAGGEMCPWGPVKVLWAVNAVAEGRHRAAVESLRGAAVNSLLDAAPDPERDDPRWFRLTYPLAHSADLLQWVAVLMGAGCRDDSRVEAAWSWLTRRRLPDGRWPLERVPGKAWADFGDVGRPNKWVTLRALALSR
jgi:hypothetical protein